MKFTEERKIKYKNQILEYLKKNPLSFTKYVADGICRDEEATLILLKELKLEEKIIEINKNEKGKIFIIRKKWKLI